MANITLVVETCIVCGADVATVEQSEDPAVCSVHNYDEVMEALLERIAFKLYDEGEIDYA